MLFTVSSRRMIVFFFVSAVLLATFSISHQVCNKHDTLEDETVCKNNGRWISKISQAAGSSDSGQSYEIMWEKDSNISVSSDGYVVAFRQWNPRRTKILNITNMNEGFTITGLSPDTRYVAMVCLAMEKPSVKFELLPGCGNCRLCFTTRTNITNTLPTSTIAGISVLTIIMGALMVGILVGLCYIRNHLCKTCRWHRTSGSVSNVEMQVGVAETPLMTRNGFLMKTLPNSMIIKPNEIELSTLIGQGEFGVVYKAFLKSDLMNAVAIKTMKGIFATAMDIENVSKEIEKMQYFKHPNVMSLIGVCMAPSQQGISSGAPCIVMPFMAKGCLLDKLRKESEEFNVMSEEDENFDRVKKVLLQMCLQIAKGMEYLAEQKFVHRDLAARNCLVDAYGKIKVSDFGLAEDIYCLNYFHQTQGGTKLPLKWLALESITKGIFTEKSDVWSFGITCWEVFTGGSNPYPGMHSQEILDFLVNGERSARPRNAACDSDMYALMQSCWDLKETYRPSFSDIVSYLTSYLEYAADYVVLNGIKSRPNTKINASSSVEVASSTPVYESSHDFHSHTPDNINDNYITFEL